MFHVLLSLPPIFAVEWCKGSDRFSPIVGEFVLTDLRTNEYIIPDLNKVGGYIRLEGWVEQNWQILKRWAKMISMCVA